MITITRSASGCADVVEEAVAASGPCGEVSHHLLDDSRAGIVERVGGFARLEENIRVLGGPAQHRPVGGQSALAVGVDGLLLK